jgi:NADH dehydrogenase FAD-containing subunit
MSAALAAARGALELAWIVCKRFVIVVLSVLACLAGVVFGSDSVETALDASRDLGLEVLAKTCFRSARPTRVVVVGGSFSGLASLRRMHGRLPLGSSITLVELRRFFEYVPAAPMAIAAGSIESVHLLTSQVVPRGVRVVHEHACSVQWDGTSGVVKCSESWVEFDKLVVATGSSYAHPVGIGVDPLSQGERFSIANRARDGIRVAPAITVVGGGTVGVELAAEIPGSRRVAVFTRAPRLMADLPSEVGANTTSWLEERGIQIHTSSSAEVLPGDELLVSPWTADLESRLTRLPSVSVVREGDSMRVKGTFPVYCGGPKVNQDPLGDALGGKLIQRDKGGRVAVNERLELVLESGEAVGGILCVGDGASGGWKMLAHAAEATGAAAGERVVQESWGMSGDWTFPRILGQAAHLPRVLAISLGPRDGVLMFESLWLGPGGVGGLLAGWVKHFIRLSKMWELQAVTWGSVLGSVAQSIWEFGDSLTLTATALIECS